MAIRYSDLKNRNKANSDFVTRRYNPSVVKLIGMFLALVACSIGVITLLLSPVNSIILLTVIIGGFGAYVIARLQASRDLVLTTEYQNALFASSLSNGYRFCCIVRKGGSITYLDSGTQRMFSEAISERQLTLSNLLTAAKAAKSVHDQVLDLAARGKEGSLVCELRAEDNRLHQVMLSIQPIKRPSGFMLVRARDYSAQEENAATKTVGAVNPLLSKSTIGMFAHIMDRMHMGMYMIDMQGNLLYANPALEEWLGFKKGEIAASNYTMRDVVHGITNADAIRPGDFEGEHSLLTKEGGLIKAFINQKIVYGDEHKPLGCVAIITNIVANDTDKKKTLW